METHAHGDRRWPVATLAGLPAAAVGLSAAAVLAGGPSVCPVALLTGVACPGCGLTRAVMALARGDLAVDRESPVSDAYDAYPEASQGVLVLVLGILGLIVCQVLAPVAWIVGNSELRGIDEGRRSPENRGIASAGRVLGIIGTVLLGIVVVFGLGFLALVIFGVASQAPAAP